MRDVLNRLKEPPSHLALAYDSWAPVENDGKLPDKDRARWLSALERLAVDPDYKVFFEERWKNSFSDSGDRLATLELTSRLLVGHGSSSGVDVGITVHHAWGVPVLPGSALKGLLAHYVDATYGPAETGGQPANLTDEERQRADYRGVTWRGSKIERGPGAVYRALFGAPAAPDGADATEDSRGETEAAAGLVTFHDALYVPNSVPKDAPFAADVLTVHQKAYYDSSGRTGPSDYDNPNPVGFLTVRPGCKLQLVLSGPPEWSDLAAGLLQEALETWGVGAKTAAGYGFGKVSEWSAPRRKLSKAEETAVALLPLGKDALVPGIEKWLLGEPVSGPMGEPLSMPLDAATPEALGVVRFLGNELRVRELWLERQKNKKADEKKKQRARLLIEKWDGLALRWEPK